VKIIKKELYQFPFNFQKFAIDIFLFSVELSSQEISGLVRNNTGYYFNIKAIADVYYSAGSIILIFKDGGFKILKPETICKIVPGFKEKYNNLMLLM
jgi:hypothetical protein